MANMKTKVLGCSLHADASGLSPGQALGLWLMMLAFTVLGAFCVWSFLFLLLRWLVEVSVGYRIGFGQYWASLVLIQFFLGMLSNVWDKEKKT